MTHATNRGPMTASGIYQVIARRGRECGVEAFPHRFRHHFSPTSLDRGGAEGDLMELNGWTSPQMLRRYGASARSARARRSYDRIMDDALSPEPAGGAATASRKAKYPSIGSAGTRRQRFSAWAFGSDPSLPPAVTQAQGAMPVEVPAPRSPLTGRALPVGRVP